MAGLEKSQFGFRSCTITHMVMFDAQICKDTYLDGHAMQRGFYLAVTAAAMLR